MISILSLAALLGAARVSVAQPYSTWMADSFLEKSVQSSRGYESAVLYRAFELAFNKTGNSSYAKFIQSQIDQFVSDSGELSNYPGQYISLDDIRIGNNLLWIWAKTGEEKYKIAADTLRSQLNITPRNHAGGFWHRSPTYPYQMWLDGIYMAETFYAQYTKWFQPDNQTAWDDIILQYDLIEEHCRNTTTNLLVHGYDESKSQVWADPITGASPNVWSRGLGWFFMALVDLLDYIPKNHPGYTKSLARFKSLAKALKNTQDKSGGWWLIMNEPYPSDPRNYIESSAVAMFTYGLLKGMRKGYIPRGDYQPVVKKAYDMMVNTFVTQNVNGTLNWEGTILGAGLGSNATFEYYISRPVDQNDFKGAGPFIYASYEIELLH